MEQREHVIRQWFDLWITNSEADLTPLFSEKAVYIESWGPEYYGRNMIERWFRDWHETGRVLIWNIQEFLHAEDSTVVRWYFQCQMNGEEPVGFDGLTLIRWDSHDKITFLQEYGCTSKRYCPYKEK